MPFAHWSLLAVSVLPLFWAIVAKAGAPYDNSRPRAVLAAAEGYRLRANWAQQNAWEALTPYVAAVIVATLHGVPATVLDAAAGVFLLARVGHGLCYLADRPTWRSLCWLAGFAVVAYLFLLGGGVLPVPGR